MKKIVRPLVTGPLQSVGPNDSPALRVGRSFVGCAFPESGESHCTLAVVSAPAASVPTWTEIVIGRKAHTATQTIHAAIATTASVRQCFTAVVPCASPETVLPSTGDHGGATPIILGVLIM